MHIIVWICLFGHAMHKTTLNSIIMVNFRDNKPQSHFHMLK